MIKIKTSIVSKRALKKFILPIGLKNRSLKMTNHFCINVSLKICQKWKDISFYIYIHCSAFIWNVFYWTFFDKFHCPWFLCFLNVRNWNAKKKCIKVFYWSDGKAKSVQLSTLVGWRVFSMLVFLYFAFSFIANGFLKFFLILWKSFFFK